MRYVASGCDRGDGAHFRLGLLIENVRAVIDGVSLLIASSAAFALRGRGASGSIWFRNVKIEPAEKGRSFELAADVPVSRYK